MNRYELDTIFQEAANARQETLDKVLTRLHDSLLPLLIRYGADPSQPPMEGQIEDLWKKLRTNFDPAEYQKLLKLIREWFLQQCKPSTDTQKNLAYIRSLPCQACGVPGRSDAHHWKTKGAGGDDSLANLVALCRTHHQEFHQSGAKTFFAKWGKSINFLRKCKGLPLIGE